MSSSLEFIANLEDTYPKYLTTPVPVDFFISADGAYDSEIKNDDIYLEGNIRFTVIDKNKNETMVDFELEKTVFNLTVHTQEKDMAIIGHVEELDFQSAKINTPGYMMSNPRDAYKMSSHFDNGKNALNGHVWGSGIDWIKLKNVTSLYFQTFEVNPHDDYVSVDLDLDTVYNTDLRGQFPQN